MIATIEAGFCVLGIIVATATVIEAVRQWPPIHRIMRAQRNGAGRFTRGGNL